MCLCTSRRWRRAQALQRNLSPLPTFPAHTVLRVLRVLVVAFLYLCACACAGERGRAGKIRGAWRSRQDGGMQADFRKSSPWQEIAAAPDVDPLQNRPQECKRGHVRACGRTKRKRGETAKAAMAVGGGGKEMSTWKALVTNVATGVHRAGRAPKP